jgi:ribonuclease HI
VKITWGLKHEVLKTIYTGGILPLLLYGSPVWKKVMNKSCYKAKLIRIQRLINIRKAKAYNTDSNEALCIITGLISFNIKIEETGNNQAEQMAILKALECIQSSKAEEKTVLVYTDSRLTLQMLQNQKKHTHLIEEIRTKVIELEQDEWKAEFSLIKAHGHRGNELADHLAKEAASSRTIGDYYTRIPKSAVLSDLNEQSIYWWQKEWGKVVKRGYNKILLP